MTMVKTKRGFPALGATDWVCGEPNNEDGEDGDFAEDQLFNLVCKQNGKWERCDGTLLALLEEIRRGGDDQLLRELRFQPDAWTPATKTKAIAERVNRQAKEMPNPPDNVEWDIRVSGSIEFAVFKWEKGLTVIQAVEAAAYGAAMFNQADDFGCVLVWHTV